MLVHTVVLLSPVMGIYDDCVLVISIVRIQNSIVLLVIGIGISQRISPLVTRDSIYATVHICHANSVCLSVCLSHACFVSK